MKRGLYLETVINASISAYYFI